MATTYEAVRWTHAMHRTDMRCARDRRSAPPKSTEVPSAKSPSPGVAWRTCENVALSRARPLFIDSDGPRAGYRYWPSSDATLGDTSCSRASSGPLARDSLHKSGELRNLSAGPSPRLASLHLTSALIYRLRARLSISIGRSLAANISQRGESGWLGETRRSSSHGLIASELFRGRMPWERSRLSCSGARGYAAQWRPLIAHRLIGRAPSRQSAGSLFTPRCEPSLRRRSSLALFAALCRDRFAAAPTRLELWFMPTEQEEDDSRHKGGPHTKDSLASPRLDSRCVGLHLGAD